MDRHHPPSNAGDEMLVVINNIPPQEIEDNFGRAVRDIVDQVEERQLVKCKEGFQAGTGKENKCPFLKFSFSEIQLTSFVQVSDDEDLI